jgi:hypothetical protein
VKQRYEVKKRREMKKSIALLMVVSSAALSCMAVCAAEQNQKPESAMLPASAYRVPIDEIIVEGRVPYWQRETPRWDKPKVEAPKPGGAGRLQWAPHYTRDERDDYTTPRDQLNPKPRAKIFELKF